MKIAFIYDHPFVKTNNIVYTSGSFPASYWETYTQGNKQLLVIGRLSNKQKGLSTSEAKNVEFNFFKNYNGPIDFFTQKQKIHKEITEFLLDINCVIIRLPSLIGIIAVNICEEKRIPYAVEVVGNAYDSLRNHSFKGKLLANYAHWINKKAIKKAPMAIYVTKHYLQSVYPCDNTQDYASNVQINSINEEQLKNRLEKIKTTNLKTLTFGTIGNIEIKYKGYDVFFKVMRKIKNKHNILLQYNIAGGGDDSYLRKLSCKYGIEDQVKFVGKLNRDEIFDYLNSLDVYVHPARAEGLPRAVIEAMSQACPCLASSVGGIPELIDYRYLHTANDSNKLYNDVLNIINKKYLLENMAIDNFKKAKEYAPNIIRERKSAFFNKLYSKI